MSVIKNVGNVASVSMVVYQKVTVILTLINLPKFIIHRICKVNPPIN